MPEANFIEFYKDKRLLGAIPVKEEARSFHVLAEDGRYHKVPFDKVVLKTRVAVDNVADENVLLPAIKRCVAAREEIGRSIAVEDLWELLEGEAYPRSVRELAEIYFGQAFSGDELSGMSRALMENRIYFERHRDEYVPKPADDVERTLHRLRVEAARSRTREELARYARALYEGRAAEAPADAGHLAELLRSYIILDKEAPSSREVEEILKAAGLSTTDAPFALLVAMGEFSPDENLLLHRFGIKVEFPGDVLEEAEALAHRVRRDPGTIAAGRTDLRHLPCFTIDSEATTEVDDALSFTTEEGLNCVGIHIADPTCLIEPESRLEEEIRRRVIAAYMPDMKIPMMPPVLGADVLSLVAGQARPALSILVRLDDGGAVRDARFERSVIVVKERLDYEESLGLIERRADMAKLYELAKLLQRGRIAAGAAVLPFLRLDVRLGKDGAVIIEREDPDRPSQVLVSEMMVLANSVMGAHCHRHAIPAVYRSQPAIEEGTAIPESYDPVALFCMRRRIRRASFSLEPSRHHGLGIDDYIQFTSPIRRYLDFVMHRQVLHFERTGAPYYTQDDLRQILFTSETALEQVDQLERDRRSYWILRYLEGMVGKKLPAVVLSSSFDRAVIALDDCLWESEIPGSAGSTPTPGQAVQVRIDRVWPRDGVVRMSLA